MSIYGAFIFALALIVLVLLVVTLFTGMYVAKIIIEEEINGGPVVEPERIPYSERTIQGFPEGTKEADVYNLK
jgi:hypothetical protein